MVLKMHNDSLAPSIKADDIFICKPVKDFEKLRSADIISFWTITDGEWVVGTGQIQNIYDAGNGQFIYEVKDHTLFVYQEEIIGQFFGVIYNKTIGFVILLAIVLIVGAMLIRNRQNKKMLAERQNTADSPEYYPQVGISDSTDLIQYKELLDMGAITPEEFEAKKKELLGL